MITYYNFTSSGCAVIGTNHIDPVLPPTGTQYQTGDPIYHVSALVHKEPMSFQSREDFYVNAEVLMHRDCTHEEHGSHRIQLPFVNMKHSDTIPIFDRVPVRVALRLFT